MTDTENLERQVGTKRRNMDAKLTLPHSKVIEIFCLSAETINSLWVSIASFNPSHPRASATVVVLNTFFQRLKKSQKAFGTSEIACAMV